MRTLFHKAACFVFGLLISFSFGQKKDVELFRKALQNSKSDTAKVNSLNNLAWAIKGSNMDTAIVLSGQALKLSHQIKWSYGEAEANRLLGAFSFLTGKLEQAFDHYNRALKIFEEIAASDNGDLSNIGKKGKSKTIGNLGVLYFNQSDYKTALELYLKALKIDEELGNTLGVSKHYANIGMIYHDQADHAKALAYFFRSLKISEQLKDKNGMARIMGNIGTIYQFQRNYRTALNYFEKALKIAEELGDKQLITVNLGNIGIVYSNISHLDSPDRKPGEIDTTLCSKARAYFLRGLKLAEEQGDLKSIAINLGNLGALCSDEMQFLILTGRKDLGVKTKLPLIIDYYRRAQSVNEQMGDKMGIINDMENLGSVSFKIGKFKEAEDYFNKALLLANQAGALAAKMTLESDLANLYDTTQRYSLAFEHYKQYIRIRDSIYSEDRQKSQVRTELNYEFEKKEAIIKEAREKERAVALEKSRFQKVVIFSVAFGLVLVLVFAGFISTTLKTTRQQKTVIEEKQQEILDSIHYAKKIQTALMTNEIYIDKSLNKLNS